MRAAGGCLHDAGNEARIYDFQGEGEGVCGLTVEGGAGLVERVCVPGGEGVVDMGGRGGGPQSYCHVSGVVDCGSPEISFSRDSAFLEPRIPVP